MPDELGSIAVGKQGDLVLVAGKPWEMISDIERVVVVMQGGRIVVDRQEQPLK